jgi:hypothetical protein
VELKVITEQDLSDASRMLSLFDKVLEWGQNGGSIDVRAMYLACRREYKWYRRSGLPWGTDLSRNEARARRVLWHGISLLAERDINFFTWEELLLVATRTYPPINVHLLMRQDRTLSTDEACAAVAFGYQPFA